MAGTVYLNGSYVDEAEAVVPVIDRGLQFADSVYEVVLVASGVPIDIAPHLARLKRSMDWLRFANQPAIFTLHGVVERLIAADAIIDGMVYIQVTRGAAPRNFAVDPALEPTVVAYGRHLTLAEKLAPVASITIATMPDQRWKNCHIKTTALTAAVLAKQSAREAGHDDAWLLDGDGYVTEACAANAWIVKDGVAITRPEGPEILSGVTRARLFALAGGVGITILERKFSRDECYAADEAFNTSATALLAPVRAIDGHTLRNGAVGPITARLHAAYLAFARGGG
jgi:D-alanine transaminase